ncbi:MAG: DNA repair protein RecO [Azorhizobium sp. 12-66-6]|nr:MAG: DNA repair protein RecO [Azorhizobium sp. 12-66-6]
MDWSDLGIVTGVRRHGETSAIVELLTRERGRHLGLVRGGLSRRRASLLQPGNTVQATWRARLDEQLGTFVLEPVQSRGEMLMRLSHGAYGITHMASLVHLLAEREPHARLYEILDAILDAFEHPAAAAELMARFELAILGDLGFGLDLEICAATGGRNDLIFVSPRTGRAVSAAAGAPYSEKLLPLPGFLTGGAPPDIAALEDAFRLTGYFLAQRVLEPRGLLLSEARAGFLNALRRDQR